MVEKRSSSPPQTYQKIYMQNNSQRKPTGNWQNIQPKLQEESPHNQEGQEKKKKKASEWDCCPWEGSVRKGKSKQADPHSYEPLSLLGNPSGQTVGLEKPTFYFQGVGLLTIRARDLCWWLAPCCTSQSKEGNTLSQSLRTVASHEIKAKNQSSFTETGKTPRV